MKDDAKFSEEIAQRNEKRAAEVMDSAQKTLDELGKLKRSDSLKLSDRLYIWQEWLGAACFGLAAIGGVVFVSNGYISIWIGLGVAFLLAGGLFISIRHKLAIEQDLAKTPLIYDSTMPQYLDKKKAAFRSWQNPCSVRDHLDTLLAERRIQKFALDGLETQMSELERRNSHPLKNVDYSGDVLIFMAITGLYLLLRQFFLQVYVSIFPSVHEIWGFKPLWLMIYTLIFLFIMNSALKGRKSAIETNLSKSKYFKQEIKHAKGYIAEIDETILEIKKQFSLK